MKNAFFESCVTSVARTFVSPQIRNAFLSLMLVGSLSCATQTLAADRVFQVLGACGLADAEFVGNAKKGRSELTSFAPDGLAGFVFEGLAGKTIGSLNTTQVSFEVPADATTFDVTVRVKVTGKPNKVQNFNVAGEGHRGVPNLPTRPRNEDGTSLALAFNNLDLLVEGSKLTADDTIEKISFIFNGTKKVKGNAIRCDVDSVAYAGMQAPIVLEPVTCNLK